MRPSLLCAGLVLSVALSGACGGASPQARTVPVQATASAPASAPVAGSPKAPPVESASPPATSRPAALPGTPIRFGGGDGSSVQTAVVIEGARGEDDGVAAEYQYIGLLYGPEGAHWHRTRQSLLQEKSRFFDAIDIVHDGSPETFYFDITGYFGKF